MLRMALGLFFTLLVAIFAVQNSSPVTVRFLWWRFPGTSLVLVILTSVIIGVLLGGGVQAYRRGHADPKPAAEIPPDVNK